MTETTARIRWEPTKYGGWTGGTGTLDGWLFQVWKAPAPVGPWRLESNLPGNFWRTKDDDDPDELKAEAERWLEEFVTSLGASFPDKPDESAAFQLSEARDVLARWDAEPGGAIMFGRERVLADQVRALLAIVASEPVPPHPEEETTDA